jgi:DNA-nicking Smr family endonuclease
VVASARGDVGDELDGRAGALRSAREAVRQFVDDAAWRACRRCRIIHGRGTGAARAVRELSRHPLVDRHESDSADSATIAHLGA